MPSLLTLHSEHGESNDQRNCFIFCLRLEKMRRGGGEELKNTKTGRVALPQKRLSEQNGDVTAVQ